MIKDLKLSQRMIEAITMGQRGNDIVGNSSTMAALVTRGLITAGYRHELTDLGHEAYAAITGRTDSRRVAESEDHPSESDMITDAEVTISDPDSAQMWADRGISPRSLSLAIEGVQPLIPAGVWVSEVLSSVSAGVTLAESILRGHIASVDGTEMWMLDETVDTVHAVYAGMADGQIERAWDEAYAMIDAQASSVGARITAKIRASGLRMDGGVSRKVPAFATAEIAAHETSELQWADVESASDYDRRNADLERADVESEYRAEREAEASEAAWVPVEVINADDFMYRTRKGIWLSAGYFATMRRMRDLRLRDLLAFRAAQKIIQERYSGGRVTFLDEMLADGKVSFTAVDKARRTILAVCNPTLGSKIKPSSKRRNRR